MWNNKSKEEKTKRLKTNNPVNFNIYRVIDPLFGIVGMAGFEPAASTSQMWRDTGLRYIPKGSAKVSFKITVANIF
jgi:hypothetical protein